MKREVKVAVAVAVPIVVGGIAYLISKVQAGLQKYLSISAGEGGTTDPAPGTYTYGLNENVTITALPNEGYTVGTWVVDGVDCGHQDSIAVTMDADHTVIVTFWEGGHPPPTVPYAIVPQAGYEVITLTSNIGVTLHRLPGTPGMQDWHTRYDYWNENWTDMTAVTVPTEFKVVDVAGKGVPDIDVALWVSDYPDTSRYRGKLLINGQEALGTQPVVVKTDADGVARAELSYLYGLDDQFKTICGDAGIGYWVSLTGIIIPIELKCPSDSYDCRSHPWWLGIPYGPHGEGESGTPPMPNLSVNFVQAQIVGLAKYAASTVKCGFHIKWASFSG